MEDFFIFLLGIGVFAAVVVALVFLVNRTKEQELKTKLEIQSLIKTLPEANRTPFLLHYNSQKKNPTTAVILALLLGGLGAHRFYLGQTGVGILYILFAWTFIPAAVAFFEAFTLSHTVHRHNQQVARETAAVMGGNIKAFV